MMIHNVYDAVLGPQLVATMDEKNPVNPHRHIKHLQNLMHSKQFKDIFNSKDGEVLASWFFEESKETAIVKEILWYSKRDYAFLFFAIYCMDDKNIRKLAERVSQKRAPRTFNIFNKGNRVALHFDTYENGVLKVKERMYDGKEAALLAVLPMLVTDGIFSWELFSTLTQFARTPEAALAMLFVNSVYGVTFKTPKQTEPLFEHSVTFPVASIVLTNEFMMNPHWKGSVLSKMLRDQKQVVPEKVGILCELESLCASKSSSLLTLEHTEGQEFKLHLKLWAVNAQKYMFPHNQILIFYDSIMRLSGHPHDQKSLRLFLGGDVKDMGRQELMEALFEPRVLDIEAYKDRKDLPLIRSSKTNGNVHYPVQLPDCVRPGLIPTQSQAITLEFMREREQARFSDLIFHPMSDKCTISWAAPVPLVQATPQEMTVAHKFGGGIIADDTGTGKTLAIILKCVTDPRDRNIIIVPDGLVLHWASEVRKHTTLNIWENEEFQNTQELVVKKRRVAKVDPGTYEAITIHRTSCVQSHNWDLQDLPRIMIVSHSALRAPSFNKLFADAHFTRMVVDEAHHCKRPEMTDFVKRDFTWIVSATPYENTQMVMKLLQFDKVYEAVFAGAKRTGAQLLNYAEYVLFRYCTVRNKFDKSHLSIEIVKHICPMTPQEKEFFKAINDIVEEQIFARFPVSDKLPRFFRILERFGAGGKLDQPVILQVIRRLFIDPTRHFDPYQNRAKQREEVCSNMMAPKRAFTAVNDDCSVCLVNFSEPVQLRCNHVVCKGCLQSMLDVGISKCPYCQKVLELPAYKPNWGAAEDTEEKKSKKRKDEVAAPAAEDVKGIRAERAVISGMTEEMYLKLSDEEKKNIVNLCGKMHALEKQLIEFNRVKSPGDQLVIFMKEQMPAKQFLDVLTKCGLTVLTAGVMGSRKIASLANIERFRKGQSDVLLVSNKYCSGFDLHMAREVWLLNSDLSLANMEQSQGRVTRVAQKHDKVIIRIFVYEHMFDDWLWESRKTLDVKGGQYRRSHLLEYYFYSMRHVPTSKVYVTGRIIDRLYPNYTGPIRSNKNGTSLSFNDEELQVSFYHGHLPYITGPGGQRYKSNDLSVMNTEAMRRLLFE